MTLSPALEALLTKIDLQLGRGAYLTVYNVVKMYGEHAAALTLAELRIAELESKLSSCEKERDDADRRAGAAEREVERLKDGEWRRNAWLSDAKREWGVDDRVSFDVVWKEALTLKSRLDTATGLLREWLAEFDCQRDGLWPCETTRAFLETK